MLAADDINELPSKERVNWPLLFVVDLMSPDVEEAAGINSIAIENCGGFFLAHIDNLSFYN